MLIKIHPSSPPLTIGLDIVQLSKIWFPELKIKENEPNDIQRLVRKLIREKHSILKTNYILLDITLPIFLYYELKEIAGDISLPRLMWKDNINFESNSKFTDKEQAMFSSYCKKIKTILKEFNTDWNLLSISDKDSKCKYFAPLSLNGNCLMYFNYLELFELLTRILKRKDHSDLYKFGSEMFKVLSQNSVFFTESNLEVFLNNDAK